MQKNGGSQPYEVRVADYDGYNQFIVNRSAQPIMSPAWSRTASVWLMYRLKIKITTCCTGFKFWRT